MTAPSNAGRHLWTVAERLVEAQTLQTVIEPTLADLQYELSAPNALFGRTRVRWSGYMAFWKVLLPYLLPGSAPMNAWLLARMAGVTLLALAGYMLLLSVLVHPLIYIYSVHGMGRSIQFSSVVWGEGVAVMMPIAVFVAGLCSARNRAHERPKDVRAYVLLAVSAGLVVPVLSTWAPSAARGLSHPAPNLAFGPSWGVHASVWLWPVAGCIAFAVLAVGLAPHLRRTVAVVVALFLVPFLTMLSQNLLLAGYRGYQYSGGVLLLLAWVFYLLVFAVGLLIIGRLRSAPASGPA